MKNFQNRIIQAVFFLLILMGLFAAPGCRTAKKIQTAISKKDTTANMMNQQTTADSLLRINRTLAKLDAKHINFNTFSAKIKVEYDGSLGKQSNIVAYVRMIKDSVIWVSMYATVFNVEAFRILIKKDSVIVLDKLNKTAIVRSMNYLQEVTGIPFDFGTLQDLIVGNPIYFNAEHIIYYKQLDGKILIAAIGKYFKQLLTLTGGDNMMLTHSKLDDVDMTRNRTADITYDNYENNTGFNFSTFREIIVSEKNKLDIRLNYKQYEFNKELQVIFNIPKNYDLK